MDIVNFDALKAQDRIIDPSQVDPNEDYFILGKYTNHYTTNSQKYTKYPVFAIKAGDVMGAIPTLQQVLDFNHDLLNGNNYQGTGAGVGNTGSQINALGTSAANSNTGNNINAFGNGAGSGNTLNGMTIFSNASIPSYANFAAASAAITVGLGATAGCTYLYHDQATNSIGAVRI